MKIASLDLINYLNNNNSFQAKDLFTIKLTNGTLLRYTNHDQAIYANGYNYIPMVISRDKITWDIGISVDELSVKFSPKTTDLVNGIPINQAFQNGIFDGAIMQVDKVFLQTGQASLVLNCLFLGRMDVDDISESIINISVKSMTELLNIQIPRNLFQTGCQWTLYGAGCVLNQSTYTHTSSVNSGSTVTVINSSLGSTYDFTQGIIAFTSGSNNQIKRTVKSYNNGVINLINPLPYTPNTGDTFTITLGCQKNVSDCVGKFNNIANYGGCCFIPVPDTMYYGAAQTSGTTTTGK